MPTRHRQLSQARPSVTRSTEAHVLASSKSRSPALCCDFAAPWMRRCWALSCAHCATAHDRPSRRDPGVACRWRDGHALRHRLAGSEGSDGAEGGSVQWHVFSFRGRRGDLVKLLWSDGDGMCMLTKRLERGRFIWPQAETGSVSLSAAQLSMLLEGIDWRHPERTWQPRMAV